MKKLNNIMATLAFIFLIAYPAYAHSTRQHLIDMGRDLIETAFSPLYGAFVKGPHNIKEEYSYEVWGREKPEDRGLLRYKIFALWRAPGELMKGVIDGVVGSAKSGGEFFKEFISIFFGD